MWPRKRLDLSWIDFTAGLAAILTPGGRAQRMRAQAGAEQAFAQLAPAAAGLSPATVLATLSVRSGLDALFTALALPAGSEVIYSALTIHDMPRIAAEHGLAPVPADVELATLAPARAALDLARTPRTRALVIAHLCGARVDLTPAVEFAREHGLLLIEDCAQAFGGPGCTGDPRADVSLFSFGTIKTATALGGGVLRFRDPDLCARTRAVAERWPVAGRGWFLNRVAKNAVLSFLTLRPCYALLVALCRLCGGDYDRIVNGAVRGFPGPEFFARIRQQPPAPLLQLLARRLRRYDVARLTRRAAQGRRLAERLIGHGDLGLPGQANPAHNFWVFPVLTAHPAELIAHLRAAGFDATQGQSLCAVAAPAGREALRPVQAERFLREVVFLPIYPGLTAAAGERLADAVLSFHAAPTAAGSPAVAPA